MRTSQPPRCRECGARATSRARTSCEYCGTVSATDQAQVGQALELVELFSADSSAMDSAIHAVPETAEFREADRPGRRQRRRRLSEWRRRQRADGGYEAAGGDEGAIQGIILTILVFALFVAPKLGAPDGMYLFGLGAWVLYYFVEDTTEPARLNCATLAYRRRRSLLPLGILEVGPSREREGTAGVRRKDVFVRTKTWKKRKMTAPADLEVAVGDVGFADVKGSMMTKFTRLGGVPTQG